ncbi:hypothetical protein DM860_011920 [Cuscuta australis]|uniref:Uncharacterized protein n=1 Tax=Cuscuta australis TaxID=267555 RepID=A0A328D8J5_9ASTE|nr:hypothetical protein DM860_011920 [Cuscuta australis]
MAVCVMASRGFSPWLLLPHHLEQGTARLLYKEHLPFIPRDGTNLEMLKSSSANLKLQQKEDIWKPMSALLNAKKVMQMNAHTSRPLLVDAQDESHSGSVIFSFCVNEQCINYEQICRYIVSGSTEILDPQAIAIGMPRWQTASCLAKPQSAFIYPSSSSSLHIPPSDVVGVFDQRINPLSFGQLSRSDMNHILSTMSEHYQFKNWNAANSRKQPMLVPYFDRRMTRGAKVKSSAQEPESVKSVASLTRSKDKKSLKTKRNKKQVKERDLYRNNTLHAFETLLSIMVDKQRRGTMVITSLMTLKKSGNDLPRLLTRLSAAIAGTALAVFLSSVCKVAAGRGVAMSASSAFFNTGLGMGLVWLSWGVNRLRDTVISITKSSSKLGMREGEVLGKLDKDVKQIYLRAVALMAVVVLRFV